LASADSGVIAEEVEDTVEETMADEQVEEALLDNVDWLGLNSEGGDGEDGRQGGEYSEGVV
jgi:hypothetical protein